MESWYRRTVLHHFPLPALFCLEKETAYFDDYCAFTGNFLFIQRSLLQTQSGNRFLRSLYPLLGTADRGNHCCACPPGKQFLADIKRKLNTLCSIIFLENPEDGEDNGGGSFANLLSLLGFILLVQAIVATRANHHFPGYRALLPTLGTMFILAAGPQTG